MKVDLGDGVYLEPDDGPRDTEHHKRILSTTPIPGTRVGYRLELECGHRPMAFGDLAKAQGVIHCLQCRDGDSPAQAVAGTVTEPPTPQGDESEIGRELKVSELKIHTVVVVLRGSTAATVWVLVVSDASVLFGALATRTLLLCTRRGPDLEQITDDSGAALTLHEYLGAI